MTAPVDHTGKKFSRLTLVERIAEKYKPTMYRCICDCGSDVIIKANAIVTGNTLSCGCLRADAARDRGMQKSGNKLPMKQEYDLTGKRFGRLVVESVQQESHTENKWVCICDCGNKSLVGRSSLMQGNTKSCGCLAEERRSKGNIKHSMHGCQEYQPWKNMWNRCTNPAGKNYEFYKDKTPPDEWRDFAVFKNDVGDRPSMSHTLDRVGNSMPYSPSNCRWATKSEQMRNKSNTIMVVYNGVVMPFIEACEILGLDYHYTLGRKYHYQDVEKASNGLFKKAT
jgi:hypothetical protein